MSISTDPAVLQQLSAIIDFIQNVATYKDVVANLQVAVTQYNDALAALSKGQTLASWEAALVVKTDKLASDTQMSEDSFAQTVATKEQALANQATDLANRQVALMQAEKDLSNRVAILSANESLAASKMADAQAASDAIAAAQADIKAREVALQDKATKLQTLLG